MTIWFSTNIPEMRAISTFNRVSTDISEIQHRITTGQRINSGKDDPGGLIIREGLRADIKGIQATQAGMTQAEIFTDVASGGMMQLLELLRGSDTNNPANGGLIGAMNGSMSDAQKETFAKDFLKLYDGAVNTTMYNGEKLLGTAGGLTKTYQLGGGAGTLEVQLSDFTTASGMGTTLKGAIEATTFDSEAVLGAAQELQTAIATALGTLGGSQSIVVMNQRLLDSRLTSVTAAEGRISNADIAIESSRMARAELLAQNAMSSIMYTRNYAAFAVSSLFR